MVDDGLEQLQATFDSANDMPPVARMLPISIAAILLGGPLAGAVVGLIVAGQGSGLWTVLLGPWWVFVGAVAGAILSGATTLVIFVVRRRRFRS